MEENENKINLGGRPVIYEHPDEMAEKLNDYFNSILLENESGIITFSIKPTISRMCFHLGICKFTFYDYAKKDDFKHVTDMARILIEGSYEEMLYEKGSSGAIFALKNFGWEDKQQLDFTNAKLATINFAKPDSEEEEENNE